ncbi:hypothetical protein H650_00090 (plasmid) [Enterobacter sp. R4-368]|nr:hypothetical protein H650_00090 [Enterobacter sp. R4-368]
MNKEKELIEYLEDRPCVLTGKDYRQVKKYYFALLELFLEKGIDMKEDAVGELLEILSATDNGDRATVLNITQHPEEVADRFK